MSQLTLWGPRVARVLLGLPFVLFGLNYFIPFMPPPPPPPEAAMPFIGGLMASGYIMPIVKSIEIVSGLALISNRFVPLALTLLAPIIVNIVAFHFILAPSYGLPTVILALELYLAYSYRAAFLPMLRARVEPAVAASGRVQEHREAAATG